MTAHRVLLAMAALLLVACISDGEDLLEEGLGQTSAALEERKVLHQVCTRPSCKNYWFALPAGHETSAGPFPLLIYLHGSGERTDGSADGMCRAETSNFACATAAGPLKHVKNGSWPADFPFIVVAPQTMAWSFDYPTGGDRTRNRETEAVVRDAITRFKVDPTRIYVTGWSMGAGGALTAAARYPELFAAVVPIAGKWGSPPGYALCDVGGVRVWGLHAQNDGTTHWSHTQRFVSALNSCYPNSARGTYPVSGGHSVANTIYAHFGSGYEGTNIYAWMLLQRRGASPAELLSEGRPASASSVHEAHAPGNAVDGTMSDESRWVSASGGPATQWLELDLQGSRVVRSGRLFTGYGDRFAIGSARLEAWDGTGWSSVASFSANPATKQIVELTLSAPVTTTRVRLVGLDNGQMRIRELQIFGDM